MAKRRVRNLTVIQKNNLSGPGGGGDGGGGSRRTSSLPNNNNNKISFQSKQEQKLII